MSSVLFDWVDDFVVESLCYVVFIGSLYGIVFVIGCAIAPFLAPRTPSHYFRRLQKFGLFLFVLLIVGDLFGFVWGAAIWGRFYRSTDYCGIDFLPFLPIRQGVIDAPFGDASHGLMGVTLFQLNLIWFPFALATWVTTLLVYWRTKRGLKLLILPNEPEQAVGGNAV